MEIANDRELERTRETLRELEERLAARARGDGPRGRAAELTRASLKRLINQLKEDIVRYESHQHIRNRV